MDSQTNLTLLITENGGFPPELVEEVAHPEEFNLDQVHRALIMVFARWSPFPVLCIQKMKGAIPPILQRAGAKFLVIDNDKLARADMARLFAMPQRGGAETFAVLDGKILGQLIGCPDGYQGLIKALAQTLIGTED